MELNSIYFKSIRYVGIIAQLLILKYFQIPSTQAIAIY